LISGAGKSKRDRELKVKKGEGKILVPEKVRSPVRYLSD
jgi:hypothetical protein